MAKAKGHESNRVISILSVSQGLYLSSMSNDLTVTALAGASLAPNAVLSTMPMATISVGSLIAAPFASRVMARFGTKPTLITGAAMAVLGGLLSWTAMTRGIFPLLRLGTFAVGIYQAIANYYRYLAADSRPGRESQSVALALSAGVVAAILGPLIASATSTLLTPLYAASYLAVSALGLGAMGTLAMLPHHDGPGAAGPDTGPVPGETPAVSIADLFRRPGFLTGTLVSATGCFAMALVMSGAPLELDHHLHVTEAARTFAMQLHMVGMYGPMLVLPVLAMRFSTLAQTWAGILLGVAGLLIGLVGNAPTITITLLLIGISWAITYATGSTLLTLSYTESERRVARGIGEFFPVFGLAAGSLLAGPMITEAGWASLSIACTAVLVTAAAVAFAYRRKLT